MWGFGVLGFWGFGAAPFQLPPNSENLGGEKEGAAKEQKEVKPKLYVMIIPRS